MSDRQGSTQRSAGAPLRRRELLLVGLLGGVLLATVAVGPMLVDARPAFEVPVHQSSDGASLSSVSGAEWGQAPPVTIPLSAAGAAVPAADDTTVEQVNLEAARTDERLYLRLSWRDTTLDNNTGEIRSFADSVALQLPANASVRPPIAMGGSDNPVNVWFWRASGTTEELLAGGAGSTTPLDETAVSTDATYRDGRWRVVFSRPLNASGEVRTTIPSDADMDVAVAVWNGSNMERSGQKAASEWYYLALGPGPQGPPYETILWVVVGVAIVATTLVTVEGVRRTRGE